MYVFISHSSKDAKSAETVCALLEGAGHQCFIAPRDIRSGREYAEELMFGIERSDVLVVMLSQNANTSPHVLREVEHAASRSIPILVYKLEEVALTKSMEYFLMTHQWLNQKADIGFDVILKSVEEMQENEKKHDVAGNDAQILQSTQNGSAKQTSALTKRIALIAAVFLVAVFAVAGVFYGKSRQQTQTEARKLVLGDFVTLGSYNNEPILWRVIHMSEDGGTAVLLTENIITMKAFDAAESTAFNVDGETDYWNCLSGDFEDWAIEAKVRGNNEWESSNIRAWLNSNAEVVSYTGGAPMKAGMSEKKNAYDAEPGFLYGFDEKEQAALIGTQIETKGVDAPQVTTDKVFLLDLDELSWLKEAGVNIYAKPTEAAVSQDATKWYQAFSLDYEIENYYWWLREPKEDSASQCYLVTNGLNADVKVPQTVGTEGFGIRPAITVDADKITQFLSE